MSVGLRVNRWALSPNRGGISHESKQMFEQPAFSRYAGVLSFDFDADKFVTFFFTCLYIFD